MKFVQWDVPELDNLKDSTVYRLRERLNGGDKLTRDDTDTEMGKWEVVSWKYGENFEDMWDLAVRAFDGTSYSPEERARYYIYSYEDTLQSDLKLIPNEERERYAAKFRERRCKRTSTASRRLIPSSSPRSSANLRASSRSSVISTSLWRTSTGCRDCSARLCKPTCAASPSPFCKNH